MKKRILSGMRPTGKLHLGHLVGALDNWIKLQEEYECLFMVADWHALMSEYENPKDLKENIIDNVADWLACGVNPEKSAIFIQSHVKEHLELYLIFSIITPLGLLERCPTYKEQLREINNRDLSTYGFLGYPVLQAADIMLYKAEAVPVGEDQLPHLELTRQIVRKFNNIYKKDYFPQTQALLTKATRLLGLDGRKMSKSYNNCIYLSDTEEEMNKKVMGMFTCPDKIRLSDPGKPEECPVYSLHKLYQKDEKILKEVAIHCKEGTIGCVDCKRKLIPCLNEELIPYRKRRAELLASGVEKIDLILRDGASRASSVANETIKEVKKAIGFIV